MMRPSGRARAVRCLVAAIALFPLGAFAKPVAKEEAATAVNGWLKRPGGAFNTPIGSAVKDVQLCKDAVGAPLCYVVNLNPSGFVILPTDDLFEPIICFSPAGKYDASDKNPLGAMVMHDIATRMAATHGPLAAEAQAQQKEAQRKWGWFRSAAVTGTATASLSSLSDGRVDPLVQSLWGQASVSTGYCYNYYTPNHEFCGCVATALAQLMRFHQYPAAAYGSAAQARLRGGDGAGGPYDWANMVLVPTRASETQRKAIGALCYDAGLSLGMQYRSNESWAHFAAAATALKKVFLYSNVICSGDRSIVGSGLNGMVNPNLDAGYPVLLAIKLSNDEGHLIIADGYGYDSSTLYHHLNMGWGGYDNVWYNLPVFSDGRYNWASYCIYNVYSSGNGEIISGRVTDGAGAPISGATVQAVGTYGNTYRGSATTNARGIFAFAKVPSASNYTLTARKSGYTFSPQNVSTGTSNNDNGTSGNVWGADFLPSANLGSGR